MIEWIVSSSVLIVVVIALRYLLRGKIRLRMQYALWALVLVRLLIPVSVGNSAISVMNAVPRQTQTVISNAERQPAEQLPQADPVQPAQDPTEVTPPDLTVNVQPAVPEAPAAKAIPWAKIAMAVWQLGAAAVGTVFLAVNLHFAAKLRRSRRKADAGESPLPVYVTGETETPCLFGLFRPAVYLTPSVLADGEALRCALTHECTHYRHGDHIWAVLRGVCLALHWYNPLVWWAAELSRRDAELACDEDTVRQLGEGERASYGRTLIRMTCEQRPALLVTATMMTDSGKGLKERITLLVKKPKPAVFTVISVVLIAALTAACTFTGQKETPAQTNGLWTSVDAYIQSEAEKLKQEDGYTYYIYGDDQNDTANSLEVTEPAEDVRIENPKCIAENEAFSSEGTLELWSFSFAVKPVDRAGALPDRFLWVGGNNIDDGGYITDGYYHLVVALQKEDGCEILQDDTTNDGLLNSWYNEHPAEYLYDFWVDHKKLDVPKYYVSEFLDSSKLITENTPMTDESAAGYRYDGDGFYLYVSTMLRRTSDTEDEWSSPYDTGCTIRVDKSADSVQTMEEFYRDGGFWQAVEDRDGGNLLDNGTWCISHEDTGDRFAINLVENPEGGCYIITRSWNVYKCAASSDYYSMESIAENEKLGMSAMERSFTLS